MKPRLQNNNTILAAALLGVLYFIMLAFLKYYLNDLSIQEYRFDYIGNVLNILISGLFIASCIVYAFSRNAPDKNKIRILLALQSISGLLLIFILFISIFNLIDSGRFLFNFPVKKVYTGFLFIISMLLQIYSMLYVIGFFLGAETFYELRTLLRTVAVIFILLIFSLFYVWNVKAYSYSRIENHSFEFGCIPGAAVWKKGVPSPIFEGRIRKALELYRIGAIKKIILTGGHAPGEIAEAEAANKYLINLGVPQRSILTETSSSTTTEQVKYIRTKFFQYLTKDSVLIISDGFHLSRVIQISKFFKVNAVGVSSDYLLSFEKSIFYRARESVALLLFWFFAI